MSWMPIGDRLETLPLILAGPILQNTSPRSVTVWIAVKQISRVDLKIYATKNRGKEIGETVMVGQAKTISLGKHLHITAVTATGEKELISEQIYAYDLTFNERLNLAKALIAPLTPEIPISYFNHELPTFLLPPQQLNRLKIVHGSCRKPHGKGEDALAILDGLLANSCADLDSRPHQLFMTGDRIYGDDVADPLLWMATEIGDTLLDWQEQLPVIDDLVKIAARDFPPGQRCQIAEREAGFTAGLHNKPEYAKSHLFSFGEYCAMYLLTHSQVFWTARVPLGKTISKSTKLARIWDRELEEIQKFSHTIWRVRRALANIPTYSIFDDHDVSDDWYLNLAWCWRVLSKPLGRRVVQNALLAYSCFQAWGNTPEQFQIGGTGRKLLEMTEIWTASQGNDDLASDRIARYLGIPDRDRHTNLPKMEVEEEFLILERDRETLTWNYEVQSPCHQVIVLDTRTWRGYPKNLEPISPPMLLCPSALEKQIDRTLARMAGEKMTIVIAPTNIFSMKAIDVIQGWYLKKRQAFHADVGDSWNMNGPALARLLTTIFSRCDRIVILSGDIHYSSVVRLDYRNSNNRGILIQLTASAFKNGEFITQLIHTKLKNILLPEKTRFWLGAIEPARMEEVSSLTKRTELPVDWQASLTWIPRQSARTPNWGKDIYLRKRLKWWHFPLTLLWQNRWLQEGGEIVGLNNLGLVSFADNQTKSQLKIIQDTYWFAVWQKGKIVYSRFQSD